MRGDAVIAIRGSGSIGQRHLRIFEGLGVAQVFAVPVRPDRVKALRADGHRACTLADLPAQVTGSVIATDTGRHLADLVELLERGPVLVEKPLVAGEGELAALHRAAAASPYPVFCAYCLRHDRSLATFAEWLPRVGAVHAVRIECGSFLPEWRPSTDYRQSYSARAADGGVLRDLSHELDYAVWLFGRPKEVFAMVREARTLEIESEEAVEIMWTGAGGALVSLHLDYLRRSPRRTMWAAGDAGELSWDGIAQSVSFTGAGPSTTLACKEPRDSMYVRQAEAFLDAAAGGSPGVLATLDDASFVVRLVDAIRRAGESHRREPISPSDLND